jgi:hypothetical protein
MVRMPPASPGPGAADDTVVSGRSGSWMVMTDEVMTGRSALV